MTAPSWAEIPPKAVAPKFEHSLPIVPRKSLIAVDVAFAPGAHHVLAETPSAIKSAEASGGFLVSTVMTSRSSPWILAPRPFEGRTEQHEAS